MFLLSVHGKHFNVESVRGHVAFKNRMVPGCFEKYKMAAKMAAIKYFSHWYITPHVLIACSVSSTDNQVI